MRISDWSSDVCSSDLSAAERLPADLDSDDFSLNRHCEERSDAAIQSGRKPLWIASLRRSAERRVGKECVVRVDLGGRRIIKKKIRVKRATIQITRRAST